MLSSLAGYSPKRLVADRISRSLADYFDVDPDSITAGLIRDATVSLAGVSVRRRTVARDPADGRAVVLGGRLGRAELSWAWDLSSALVRDVRLAIDGVRVSLTLEDRDGAAPGSSDAGDDHAGAGHLNLGPSAPVENPESDWKAGYLRQIVDHLTLIVDDVEISIETGGGRVLLRADDIRLRTTERGGGADAPLEQTLALGSVRGHVESAPGPGPDTLPLVDDFGYEATVRRFAGRRFDGLLSGLAVDGAGGPRSAVRVHAGRGQARALGRLRGLLLGFVDGGAPAEDASDEGDPEPESCGGSGGSSSVFALPFRSYEVVLTDDDGDSTKLRADGCTINYCTDGSKLQLECARGLHIDDVPLSTDARWIADLVANSAFLEPAARDCERVDGESFFESEGGDDDHGDDRVYVLTASEESLLKLGGKLASISASHAPSRKAAAPASPWSVEIAGTVVLRPAAPTTDGHELSMRNPKYWQLSGVDYFTVESACVKSRTGARLLDLASVRCSKAVAGGLGTMDVAVATAEGHLPMCTFSCEGARLKCKIDEDISTSSSFLPLGIMDASLSIERVGKLVCEDNFELTSPMANATVRIGEGSVDIDCDRIVATYLGKMETGPDSESPSAPTIDLAVPICLAARHIELEDLDGSHKVSCSKVGAKLSNVEQTVYRPSPTSALRSSRPVCPPRSTVC